MAEDVNMKFENEHMIKQSLMQEPRDECEKSDAIMIDNNSSEKTKALKKRTKVSMSNQRCPSDMMHERRRGVYPQDTAVEDRARETAVREAALGPAAIVGIQQVCESVTITKFKQEYEFSMQSRGAFVKEQQNFMDKNENHCSDFEDRECLYHESESPNKHKKYVPHNTKFQHKHQESVTDENEFQYKQQYLLLEDSESQHKSEAFMSHERNNPHKHQHDTSQQHLSNERYCPVKEGKMIYAQMNKNLMREVMDYDMKELFSNSGHDDPPPQQEHLPQKQWSRVIKEEIVHYTDLTQEVVDDGTRERESTHTTLEDHTLPIITNNWREEYLHSGKVDLSTLQVKGEDRNEGSFHSDRIYHRAHEIYEDTNKGFLCSGVQEYRAKEVTANARSFSKIQSENSKSTKSRIPHGHWTRKYTCGDGIRKSQMDWHGESGDIRELGSNGYVMAGKVCRRKEMDANTQAGPQLQRHIQLGAICLRAECNNTNKQQHRQHEEPHPQHVPEHLPQQLGHHEGLAPSLHDQNEASYSSLYGCYETSLPPKEEHHLMTYSTSENDTHTPGLDLHDTSPLTRDQLLTSQRSQEIKTLNTKYKWRTRRHRIKQGMRDIGGEREVEGGRRGGTEVEEQFADSPQTSQTFRCVLCEAITRDAPSLARHLLLHAPTRPYACTQCTSRFNQLVHLQVHQRTHTGEKPFTCHTCGSKFSRKDRLRSHERTHTEDRPYRCPYCDATYCDMPSLKIHLRTHVEERPFTCRVCHATFVQLSTFTSHWQMHYL
ncbi:Zinc finger protein 69-like [Homarus americanus]|uniref:Zinc finger protein 69-like n=1 Tax=Homarus americanus TaxID=6706 RepID=A0A8J5N8M9_HOMAM|nr:Zinc finger protein 69-like [Homarus americanus]